jgi:hypothetical protein
MTVPQTSSSPSPLWLRIGFWICVIIGAAAVIRRLFALASPAQNGPPQMAGLDDAFASHTALTLAHIIPAILFVLVAPFAVFSRFARLRGPDQGAQRPVSVAGVAERVLFPLGVVVGLTAYAMATYAVGGWIERSGIYLFDSLFLFSLARSFRYRQLGEPALKRRWLLRSIAVLLGIGTARPVMGVFFATSRLTHLRPDEFFGIAMWLGFSINLLVFELWIRSVDRRLQVAPASVATLDPAAHTRGVSL